MQVRRLVQSSSRAAVGRAAILALAAGTLLASGCDRGNPQARGIASGSAKLQANSGGAFSSPYEGVDAKNYKETIATAKPIADAAGKSPMGAAASSLVGDSQLGQAQSILDQAALAEQVALDKVSMVRVLLSNWLAYNVEADSASGFDPKAMIAQIEADRAERDKEVQSLEAHLQDLQRQLTDLRAKAKSRFEEAAKLSEEFSKARESLGTVSAAEAESRLSTARESKRKGDAIRVEASRLQAQAEVLQPEADEVAVLIAATKNRVAGLDREKLELNEKAQQGRAAASQSRSAAADTAKQIEAALADLAAFRTSEVNSKFDAAIAALRTAATSARAASADAGSSGGKLLTGRVQLSLAGALASKAASLAIYSSLLREAATVNPALPFAASIAAPEKEASDLSKTSTDDAKAAYEASQSAFSSVQLRGPGAAAIKERLTLLADALGVLAGKAAPSEAPPAPEPAKPESTPATAAPAQTSAAPAGDASATWEQIYAAMESGNKPVFMSLVKLQDPAHEPILAAVLTLTVVQEKLDAACKSKFGKSMGQAQAEAAGISAPTKASDYKVDTQGDAATISHPGNPMVLKLVRENGKWLLESSSIASGPVAMMGQMVGPLSAAMESITVDVESGKITRIEDVAIELQKRAMAGMKPGGGG